MIVLMYCAASICLFAAIHSLRLGIGSPESRLHTAFSIMCLAAIGYLIATSHYHSTTNIEDATLALRLRSAAWLLYLPPLAWFFARLANTANTDRVLAGYSMICVALAVHTSVAPASIHFTSISTLQSVSTSLGDEARFLTGPENSLGLAFHAATLIGALWALNCIMRIRKSSRIRLTFALYLYVALQIASVFAAAVLNLRDVQIIYLAWLPTFWLIIVISLYLNEREVAKRKALELELSARKQAEANQKVFRETDRLTGLPSYMSLVEHLDELLANNRDLYANLLLIELADFKSVNQQFGYAVGDDFLRSVAKRLNESVDDGTFVARVDGDRFAVVFPHASNHAEFNSKLCDDDWARLKSLNQPYEIGPHRISQHYAVGAIALDHNIENAYAALHAATLAAREARAKKQTLMFYDDAMAQANLNLQIIERDLPQAIAKGALTVSYQPIISAAGGLIGAESLCRWNHESLGDVSPRLFIESAEKLGLISDLGWWLIKQCCLRLRVWKDQGIPFNGRLSINISPLQLQQQGFAQRLLSIVGSHGISAERLTIEVPESVATTQERNVLRELGMLREAGILITNDDFGTGFSTLSRLDKLPLDIIKIDRSFVHEIEEDQFRQLIRTIIEMAAGLDIDVIAEGVETASQEERLRQMGCTAFQGYRWSKPLPGKQFAVWAKAWAAAPVLADAG